MEFRGVANIDANGEVICFCSHLEVLQGKCSCQAKYDLPEALITIEVIPGSRPSEKGVKKVAKTTKEIGKEVVKIKEGLSRLEKAVKNTKFRI